VPSCVLVRDRAGVIETSTIIHGTTGRTNHTIPSPFKRAGFRHDSQPHSIYRGADKSLARPTSPYILFDGENTLTEVFPCFFLSYKANARVNLAKTEHGPHSPKLLCCSMYCLFCVVLCIVCV
jgi:hypothetical protein